MKSNLILTIAIPVILCSCHRSHLMSDSQKKENEGYHALSAQKVINHRKENKEKHDKIKEEKQKAEQERLANLNKTNPKVKPAKKKSGEFHFF
jgi:hypothetical protein